MKKRNLFPIILMLTAGAITSIIAYLRDYGLTKMLWMLLGTLIIFYLLGLGVKRILDVFDEQIKEAEEKEEKENEGSVIEKELNEENEGQNTEEAGEAQG